MTLKTTLVLAALLIGGQARAMTNPDPNNAPLPRDEPKCFMTNKPDLTVCQFSYGGRTPDCFGTRSPGAELMLCQWYSEKDAHEALMRCIQRRADALQRYNSLDVIVSLHVAERNCERAWGAILWLQDGAPKY
jgi:hypothetical protein